MNNKNKIKNKLISLSTPVFIIAEIGVNYNGDLSLAKKMILKAKECGADCVKIQTFKADEIVTIQANKAYYQKKTTNKNESQYEMLKKLETSDQDLIKLTKFCKKNNIILISTPYTINDIDKLDELNFPAFKIASMHLTEKAF